MRQPWEILVVVLDIEPRDHLVTVLFQLRTEHWVCFRSADLHRHRDIVNFCLLEKRWMSGRDAVDQIIS